jgi:chromate transporter
MENRENEMGNGTNEERTKSGLPERNTRLLLAICGIALKIGTFTFGAGYAMFPLMRSEYAEKRRWFSESELLDVLAVGQSLPGMISVNASALIGYRLYGVLGAAVAVFSLVLPSVVLLSILTLFYVKFMANPYVHAALNGIGAGVVALLAQTAWKLAKPELKSVFGWLVAGAAFVLFFVFPGQILLMILAGIAAGLAYSVARSRRAAKGGEAK